MKFTILLILLIMPVMALGATIQGTVYDMGLTPAASIVTISTTPTQRAVTEDGKYSFDVPKGIYTLTAVQQEGKTITAQANETITIDDEGNYQVDIILYPLSQLDAPDIPETQDLNDIWTDKQGNYTKWIIGILIGFLAFGIAAWIVLRRKPKAPEDELHDVLDYIRKEKRTTQKDIRNAFPHSEAKISLALTQLEKERKIEKIKKGRGNVIVYKKG